MRELVRERSLLIGLLVLVAAGTAIRLVLAGDANPVHADARGFRVIGEAFGRDPLQAYDGTRRFPYPPALLPWVSLSTGDAVEQALGYHTMLRLPMIASDAAIAWFVQDYLGRRGLGGRVRLAAAALVALGPIFVAVSGYHGQIDSAAILPAVAALWAWDRGGDHRGLAAGVLLGIGTAVKTVPIFLLLALLPWVSSRRELAALALPAVAIPLLAVAPFLVADADDTYASLRFNRGFPGLGGVSLVLLNPRLPADFWQNLIGLSKGEVFALLEDVQQPATILALIAVGTLIWKVRPSPVQSACLIWLAVVVIGPNFTWHYLVWAFPFFVMAGFLREVAVFQIAAIPALYLFYRPQAAEGFTFDFYIVLALTLYATLVAVLALATRAALGGGGRAVR